MKEPATEVAIFVLLYSSACLTAGLGCVLGVEYSLAFPSVARKKQMFQFLSPLPMLPYAHISNSRTSVLAHRPWTVQGRGTAEALQLSGVCVLFVELSGELTTQSIKLRGEAHGSSSAPGAAQCRHPGVLLAVGIGVLSVWECSRVLPHGLLLCYCLMAFTCRGCVAVCKQREPSEPRSSASARQSVG